MRSIIYVLPLIVFVIGCTTYSENEKTEFNTKIKSYLNERGIKCKISPSGLFYRIDKEGTGRFIQFQDSVTISYLGKLLTGKVVDQQLKPITFAVKDLIPAWKELLLELKKDSKAYMVVPPYLGYGSNNLEKIPPHSILAFKLVVHNVK